MEDIFQALQAWENENKVEPKEEEVEGTEQQDQSQEVDESNEQQVNSFWDISYGLGEEGRYRGSTYVPKCSNH
jgi:hypothetical protein